MKSNLRNLKARNSILKTCGLVGLIAGWMVIALVVSNYRTALASTDTTAIQTTETEDEEIVPDDSQEFDIEELAQDIVLEDVINDLMEQPLVAAVVEILDVEDLIMPETEEIDDYSGAPSDVPREALVRLETEVPLVEEQETEDETEPQTEEKPTEISDYPYDYDQAVALAQLMWAEARGCSMREQSLVAWTVLNRVDACYDGMSDFWSILTAPSQFAYSPGNPFEEYELRIAVDVLQRWAAEKDGVEDSGRTLPKGYLYYYGDGAHNYFGMNGFSNELWFGLGDPYETWTA